MKRLAIVALVILAVGLTTQEAQAQLYGEGFGDLYLVNDVAADPWDSATATCNDNATDPIPAFQAFTWYLVVHVDFADIGLGNQNGSNGLQAWEAGVSIPDEITVTGSTFNPPGSVNVGQPPADPNDSNWIVGTGVIVTAASTPIQLVTYNGLLLADATNLEITILAAEPSSFTSVGGPGEVPGWVEWNETGECASHCLRQFARWDVCETSFVVNYDEAGETCESRCIVATESTSWGGLKSRF
jgi:hypothetical protein